MEDTPQYSQPTLLADDELTYLAFLEHGATSGKWRIQFDIEDDKVTDKHIGIENEAGTLVIRDDWGFAMQEDFELICAARNALPALLATLRATRANLSAALATLDIENTTATPEPAAAEVAADLREATTGVAKVWLLYNESGEVVGVYTDEATATAAIEYDRSFLAWPSPAESYTVRELEVESGKGGAYAAQ